MHIPQSIPSNAEVRKFIKSIVFGRNVFCPECKSRCVVKDGKRFRCKKCRIRFSLLSHTWISNLKIPLRQFWLIVWCYTAQIPINQASGVCNLSQKAIRLWYDTFRQNLPKNKIILEKIVQLDEAYFGGFRGKCLLMAKQKGERKLAFEVIGHDPAREDAIEFVRNNIKPNSTLATDGYSIYDGIEKYHHLIHIVDIHDSWEFGETSEIEGIFGNLRTFIRRMYHHVTLNNLEKMVSEFTFRFTHPEIYKNPRIFLQITLCLVTTGY